MSDRNAPADPRSAAVARPRVLAVASGKGGVGKSSIVVNLGITLARRGRRVCILDGDTGLANVNILLGLRPEQGLAEVLAGECAIEDILLEGPHGMQIIPGASGIREYAELSAAHQQRLVAELERIEEDFDDLLLDTAAGIGDTTLDFLGASHQVLLVLTPEPTSLTDAFSLLKLALRRQALDLRVIVNMVADIAEARSVFQRFANAVEKYLHTRAEFLGFVQRDESLRSAVTLQHPVALFAESDPSARPFQRLANALEDDAPRYTTAAFSRFWQERVDATPAISGAVMPEPETTPAVQPASRPEVSAEEVSVESVRPSAAEDAPASALDDLYTAFEAALEQAGSVALAAALNALHERYWAHAGRPAIDVGALAAALAARPEANAEVLDALRRVLPEAGAPGRDTAHDTAHDGAGRPSPGESPAAAPAVANASPTPPPDFGWRAAGEQRLKVGTIAARQAPGYDQDRFGSQDALAERLRQLGAEDGNLAEFLRRM